MRGGNKITRADYFEHSVGTKNSTWLEDTLNAIAKAQESVEAQTIVEQGRDRSSSFLDQINSILSPKQSVEGKIQDYHEKTGLKEYLEKNKIASEILSSLNSDTKDKILTFIKNKITSNRGLVSLPALQEELLNTFKTQGVSPDEIHDPVLSKYISDQILEEKKKFPDMQLDHSNLGKADLDVGNVSDYGKNEDFFTSLMPTNKGQ